MASMDTTRTDELLIELETADPADAATVAEELSSALTDALEQAETVS